MRISLLFCLATFSATLTLAQQYTGPGARTLTRNIAPPPPPPARPGVAGSAGGGTVAPAPARPVDPAKVQAEKQKSESDLIKFHRARAEAGSDNAQYEMGIRYLAGNGLEKDEKLGREWLEKSAKAGNVKAIKKLEELGPSKVEKPADAPK